MICQPSGNRLSRRGSLGKLPSKPASLPVPHGPTTAPDADARERSGSLLPVRTWGGRQRSAACPPETRAESTQERHKNTSANTKRARLYRRAAPPHSAPALPALPLLQGVNCPGEARSPGADRGEREPAAASHRSRASRALRHPRWAAATPTRRGAPLFLSLAQC